MNTFERGYRGGTGWGKGVTVCNFTKKCVGTTEVAGIQCPKEKDMRRNEWDCIQTVSYFETFVPKCTSRVYLVLFL